MTDVATHCISEINNCLELLEDPNSMEIMVTRVDSLIAAINLTRSTEDLSWGSRVVRLLEEASLLLVLHIEALHSFPKIGRPRLMVPMTSVEYLLSMNFKATKIAELYGISRETLCRRMKMSGVSVHNFI